VPALGQTKMKDWQPAVMQQHSDLSTTVFMGPMGPPSGDDLICPNTRLDNRAIIFWPDRIARRPHLAGIGVAPGKNVGDAKGSESQGAGAPFTAFHGRVVLKFGCG